MVTMNEVQFTSCFDQRSLCDDKAYQAFSHMSCRLLLIKHETNRRQVALRTLFHLLGVCGINKGLAHTLMVPEQ